MIAVLILSLVASDRVAESCRHSLSRSAWELSPAWFSLEMVVVLAGMLAEAGMFVVPGEFVEPGELVEPTPLVDAGMVAPAGAFAQGLVCSSSNTSSPESSESFS